MKIITHPYTFQRYGNVSCWLDRCRSWLEQDEAINGLKLGLADALAPLQDHYQPLCLAVEDAQGKLCSTGLQTEPFRSLILAADANLPDVFFEFFAAYLAEMPNLQLPGLVGPRDAVRGLADAWKRGTGRSWNVVMEQLVYRLDRVTPPANPAPGQLRQATETDFPLISTWVEAFQHEAMGSAAQDDAPAVARTKIAAGEIYLWEDGKAVAMAASARPSRHGITVNYVYTPPEQRGRGYAGSCVAALSQTLLDQGYQFCTLFTDANFPTSNRIYQRIGYRPITEFAMVTFSG